MNEGWAPYPQQRGLRDMDTVHWQGAVAVPSWTSPPGESVPSAGRRVAVQGGAAPVVLAHGEHGQRDDAGQCLRGRDGGISAEQMGLLG